MSENSKVAESDLFNEQGISCIEILVSNFDASQYCCKRMKQSLPLVGIYNTNVYGKISFAPLNILKYFEQCIKGNFYNRIFSSIHRNGVQTYLAIILVYR